MFTDGPFVETKEHLGGLAVVDVADEEEARLWAGKIAVACGWPQEVRRFELRTQRPENWSRSRGLFTAQPRRIPALRRYAGRSPSQVSTSVTGPVNVVMPATPYVATIVSASAPAAAISGDFSAAFIASASSNHSSATRYGASPRPSARGRLSVNRRRPGSFEASGTCTSR